MNSALQRARKTLDERLPDQTQQATLRSLGEERVREVVESYMDAMARGDVDAVVAMLTEDAAWSMPPMTTWYRGRDAIVPFLADWPLSGEWRWRHLPAHANGQPAVGSYTWDEKAGSYRGFALDVLTLRDGRIEEITAFVTAQARDPERPGRWPEEPVDPHRVAAFFERFGLPTELPA